MRATVVLEQLGYFFGWLIVFRVLQVYMCHAQDALQAVNDPTAGLDAP
jgi:hypothetical protein